VLGNCSRDKSRATSALRNNTDCRSIACARRIRRLEKHSDSGDYFVVGVEFTEIESGDSRIVFDADLQDVDRTSGAEWLLSSSSFSSRNLPGFGQREVSKTETTYLYSLPGVGSFLFVVSHSHCRRASAWSGRRAATNSSISRVSPPRL